MPEAALVAGRQSLRDAGWDGVRPLILLHPGAGGAAKRWPVEGFATVAGTLRGVRSVTVAVHQGPADAEAASALATMLDPDAIVLREPSLLTLAGVMAAATLYLGNDSGVSHLAAAVGAPSVVLYTQGLLAWRPWAPTRLLVVSTLEIVPAELREVLDTACAAMALDSTA